MSPSPSTGGEGRREEAPSCQFVKFVSSPHPWPSSVIFAFSSVKFPSLDPSITSHLSLCCVMVMTRQNEQISIKVNRHMNNQVNVKQWVAMFQEIGLDHAQMEQWHKVFETRHPAGHQSFLEWLG